MPTSLLDYMSKDLLLLPKEDVQYLINSAPHRYKVYQVPKRPGEGMRTIAQPAREIKRLQYWVITNVIRRLPVHPSAIAYVAGKNIRSNASPHTSNPYLLKLDFRDFFPSIKGGDFMRYALDSGGLGFIHPDLGKLVSILFWRPKGESELRLSIGAPSSPSLSNAIMYRFDAQIAEYCAQHEVVYTRYADDMTFSMRDKVKRGLLWQNVTQVLKALPYPRLTINEKKTVYGSKAHRRMVTGLILSNEGSVSLGREKKRRIRARIHHFTGGDLSEEERQSLRGMLAFARSVEPDFVQRMEHKYGAAVIQSI